MSDEWPAVRGRLVKMKHLDQTVFQTWQQLLSEKSFTDNNPNICKLAQIFLVNLTASVECERGFSKLNIVKTKLRNALTTETCDVLMRISISGPELNDPALKSLMLHAYQEWSKTPRRTDPKMHMSSIISSKN